VKKSKAPAADGSLKKKEKSKAGKYSKVPPPKQQEEDDQEPMEGMWNYVINYAALTKLIVVQ
jgi:hypothetical protein